MALNRKRLNSKWNAYNNSISKGLRREMEAVLTRGPTQEEAEAEAEERRRQREQEPRIKLEVANG